MYVDESSPEAGDRPAAMQHIDEAEQGADRYQPAHFGQQAASYGNTAAKAQDLGQQLKTHRDDLLRGWEGKDADAIADHVDKLIKGAQGMEDKATEAQGALKDVTSIMEKAKAEIKQIAAEAKKADKNNRKLIADAKTSKSDDLESASKTIAKLKADNEHMSGQAQKQIEQKLNAVESQIDTALKPLGIKIAPGGGFTDITPANPNPGGAPTTANNFGGQGDAPIQQQPLTSTGGTGGTGGAAAGATSASSSGASSSGVSSPSGTSGPVPKGVEDGPAPTAVGAKSGPDPAVAKVIYEVGKKLHVNDKVMLCAFETGLTESGMQNLTGGDRDSVGVFQQRPSCGWGNVQQCETVSHAANEFLTRAIAADKSNPGLSPGELAQKVQASAFPARYDQHQAPAQQLLDQTKQSFAGKSK